MTTSTTATTAALVLGASGSVGQALLAELVRSQAFSPIISFVRRPLEQNAAIKEVILPTMDPAAVTQAVVDSLKDCSGRAVGFSTLGVGGGTAKITIEQHRSVDVALNAAFARGLKQSGKVEHLAFMSAAGASATAKTTGSGAAGFARYNRVKGEAEEAVKASGLSVVSIFRPAMIIGSQHTPGFLERLIPLFAFLTPAKFLSITTAQIGQAMVAAGKKTPSQSAIYHYPEMMTLIAQQP
jgi:uncharacterized protein YbjT (DUF2867 family)